MIVVVVLKESLKGFSSKFQGGHMRASRICIGYLLEVSIICSWCYKEVSCCMAIIATTRAEGGLLS